MKKIYLLLLVMISWCAGAQNITQLEYFIDADPGYGSATNVVIASSPALSDFTFNVPLAAVSDGFHTLYVRVKNTNNKWSYTQRTPFVKLGVPVNISRVEYFIDNDPGLGNGTAITFTTGTTLTNLTFEVPVTSLSEGLHTLYVRLKDINNKWSMVKSTPFVKIPAAPDITYVEYYIDTDPGQGNGTSVPVTPATAITDLNFEVDVSGLSSGNHTLYVRVKNANDRWSAAYSSVFSVCDLPAPVISEATDITATSFKVSWSPVPGATSYIVEVSDDDFVTLVEGNNLKPNTTYKVRVRAVGACTSANSNVVTFTTSACSVPPTPTIVVSNEHTASPVLTSSAATGNQWYKNGAIISGATGNKLTVTEPGVYKVQVTDGDCISEFSDDFVLVITGLEEPSDNRVILYPNPVQDWLYVHGIDKVVNSKLVDVAGRELNVSFHSDGMVLRANVQHLLPGLYLIYIQDRLTQRQLKFFKK